MSWIVTNREDYVCKVRSELFKLGQPFFITDKDNFDSPFYKILYKATTQLDDIFNVYFIRAPIRTSVDINITTEKIKRANRILKELYNRYLIYKLENKIAHHNRWAILFYICIF